MIGLSKPGAKDWPCRGDLCLRVGAVEEFCAPYAVCRYRSVKLPPADEVNSWSGEQLAGLFGISIEPEFNPHMRQLIHISFKVAAKQGDRYLDLLTNEEVVGKNVTENIYERHLKPLFIGWLGDSPPSTPARRSGALWVLGGGTFLVMGASVRWPLWPSVGDAERFGLGLGLLERFGRHPAFLETPADAFAHLKMEGSAMA